MGGHDVTRSIAITKTKKKYVDNGLEGVEEKKLLHLNHTYWETYVSKYPIIGVLVDPPYDPRLYDQYAGPYDSVRVSRAVTADAPPKKRQSKCPVTRVARAIGKKVAEMTRLMLA